MSSELDRDEIIIRYVLEHKVARVDQIHRDCMPIVSKRSAYRTLAKYCRQKLLIKKGHTGPLGPCYVYMLSPIGLELLRSFYAYEVDRPILKSYALKHDLTLLDVVECIKKFEMVKEWVSENALRSCSEFEQDKGLREFAWLHSDSFLRVKVQDQELNFALEYDRSRKSKLRYRQKFKDYYDQSQVHVVLYVVTNRSFLEYLKTIDQEVRDERRSKFYFCLEEDVLKNNGNINFVNSKGETFVLK